MATIGRDDTVRQTRPGKSLPITFITTVGAGFVATIGRDDTMRQTRPGKSSFPHSHRHSTTKIGGWALCAGAGLH